MDREELIAFIQTYVRNSSVDSFTNLRLQTILLAITGMGVTSVFDSYEQFQAAIDAKPDQTLTAYIAYDEELTNEEDVILMRVPGRGIAQVAADFLTDERE